MTDQRTKIDGKFYPLQNEEWLKACQELKPAEVQVLYYLRTLDPFGDKELELGVTAIALKLGLSKGTVSKALKSLNSKGWIDLELIKVKVKLHTHRHSQEKFPTGNSVSHRKQRFPQETAFPTGNSVSHRKLRFPTGNNRRLKRPRSKAFRSLRLIKTLKTLSQKARERNFLILLGRKSKIYRSQ